MRKLHPSIVLRTRKGHEWWATEYWDTRAMKAGKPYIYRDKDPLDLIENWAGPVKDMHTLNEKRWSERRRKPRRFKYANSHDTTARPNGKDTETWIELEHLMKDNRTKAITEIETAWLDTREPSWPAVKHIREKNWEAAAAIFSHA